MGSWGYRLQIHRFAQDSDDDVKEGKPHLYEKASDTNEVEERHGD